ncbi:hypothetical protein [Polaribacter sp.]|uniref:hypothetical protein n=1 Tax=Polaribacter sp. TaxID=1920175 RepID=UPI003F6C1D9E
MIKSKLLKIVLVIVLSTNSLRAQELSEKWGIGLNTSSVLYSSEDGPTVGGRYIATLPGISVSRYLGKKVTISVMFSNAINDTQQYFSSDFNLSYDIFNPDSFLRPYLLAGVGVVNLLDSGLTLNLGGGGTLWVSKNIGLNAQLMYKVSTIGGELQKSHFFGSAGIVYSFSPSRNKRLWEQ